METIRIETVLELVAPEIWRKKKYLEKRATTTDIPSLHEQMLLVQNLLPQATFDGRTLSFGENNCGLYEIPFFNYLMLHSESVFTEHLDGTCSVTDIKWSITGFSSFEALNNFIQQQEFLCDFYIYIRHREHYRQVQYRMSFQRPDEEKTYTNAWGFYCPDADLNDIYSRNPNYQYFFEIVGLCELRHKNDIRCYILNSLDDLNEYFLARSINCEALLQRGSGRIADDHFAEIGTVYYQGTEYTYCIKVTHQETGWEFYDCDGNPYCVKYHTFCSREKTCCEESQYYNGGPHY